jgi:hypothetical protein
MVAQAKSNASAEVEEALQKAVQNPVASLISVPLQNNTNFDIGTFNRTQNVLNIQPVIPANISKNWMLITRGNPIPIKTRAANSGSAIWFLHFSFRPEGGEIDLGRRPGNDYGYWCKPMSQACAACSPLAGVLSGVSRQILPLALRWVAGS